MGELEAANDLYSCPCGKQFKRRAPYQRHMDVAHSSTQSYRCKVCSKTFGNRNTMTMHMSVHEEKQQPFSKVDNCKGRSKRSRSGNRGRSGERKAKDASTERVVPQKPQCRSPSEGHEEVHGVETLARDRAESMDHDIVTTSPLPPNIMTTASATDRSPNGEPVRLQSGCNTPEYHAGSPAGSDAQSNCQVSAEGAVVGHANCTPVTKAAGDAGSSDVDAADAETEVIASGAAVARGSDITGLSPGVHGSTCRLQQSPQQQQQHQQQQHTERSIPTMVTNQGNSVQPPQQQQEQIVIVTKASHVANQQQQQQQQQQLQQQQQQHQVPILVKATTSLSGPKQGMSTFMYPTTISELENGDTSDVENMIIGSSQLPEDGDAEDRNGVRKSDRLRDKVPRWKTTGEDTDWVHLQDGGGKVGGRKRRLSKVFKANEGEMDCIKEEETTSPLPFFNDMTADISALLQAEGMEATSVAKRSHSNKTDLFTCKVCSKAFFSEKYLSMHSALHGASYPTENLLSDTFKQEQEVEMLPKFNAKANTSSWTCKICNKTFAQNSNFKNHMRTHSDERPFVCDICCIGFKERYHLKKHQLFKHSTELKEKCRVCGKRFKDSTAVRAHERIHSDVRPYSCRRCGKAFKTSECLWHHENRSKTCGQAVGAPLPPLQRAKRGRPANKKHRNTTDSASATNGIINMLPILKVEPVMKVEVEPLVPLQPENIIVKNEPNQNNHCQQKVLVKTEPIDIDADLEALANDILPDIETTIAAAQLDQLPFKALNQDIFSGINMVSGLSNLLGQQQHQEQELQHKPISGVQNITEAHLPVVVQNAMKAEQPQSCKFPNNNAMPAKIGQPSLDVPVKVNLLPNTTAGINHGTQIPVSVAMTQMKLPLLVEEVNNGHTTVPTQNKRFECLTCGRGFATSVALDRHSLTHSEVRPYHCDICDLGFKLKVHLKKHNLYRHSDEYPCECHICGKKFKDSSAVRLHERIHSDHRPFSCSCGKNFKTRENLWGHQHRGPCEFLNVGIDPSPRNASALLANGVSAHATIKDNEIIAQAILDNNKVLAKATIGNNGEVTASATVSSANGTAHATFNTSEGTAYATVSPCSTNNPLTTLTKESASQFTPVLATSGTNGTSTQVSRLPVAPAMTSSPAAVTTTMLYKEEKRTIQFVDVTPAPIVHERPAKSLSLPPFETFAPIGRSPASSPAPSLSPPTAIPAIMNNNSKPREIQPKMHSKRPLTMAERCPTIQKCLMQKGHSPMKLPGIQHLFQNRVATSSYQSGLAQTSTTVNNRLLTAAATSSMPANVTTSALPMVTASQPFMTDDNPMLSSSREPYMRSPPPYKPRDTNSPYSTADYSPMPVTNGVYSPYQVVRPSSVCSDFSERRSESVADSGLPIIYWGDDESDQKSESCGAWPSESDALFQEISASGLL